MRASWRVRINSAKALFQNISIDDPGELRQRLTHIDDLIKSRTKQVVGFCDPEFFWAHVDPLERINHLRESRSHPKIKLQKNSSV